MNYNYKFGIVAFVILGLLAVLHTSGVFVFVGLIALFVTAIAWFMHSQYDNDYTRARQYWKQKDEEFSK